MSKNQTANSASLPRDDDSAPIQTLSPHPTGNVQISATSGASASVQLPANTEIVRIAAEQPVWLAFGGSGVAAASGESDSMLFPAGVEVFSLRDSNFTYVAARALSTSGAVTATKME